MQRFDPENASAVAADVLFAQAMGTSGNLHQAYLCCTSTRFGPRIYCIHLPSLIMIVNTIAHITEYIQANIQTLKGLDVFPA